MARKTRRRAVPPKLGDPEWFSPEHVERRRRKLTRQLFHVRETQYRLTKNPAFVWAAIDEASRLGVALPAWVRPYLGRVAHQIAELSRTHAPGKAEPTRSVYHALEFHNQRGAPNPFAAMHDQWHEVNIALEMWWYVSDGHQETYAKAIVAEQHPARCTLTPKCTAIGAATVLRCWKKYERTIRT